MNSLLELGPQISAADSGTGKTKFVLDAQPTRSSTKTEFVSPLVINAEPSANKENVPLAIKVMTLPAVPVSFLPLTLPDHQISDALFGTGTTKSVSPALPGGSEVPLLMPAFL